MTSVLRLSPEQMSAVGSDAPLLVVAAGAGTGKTTTLTARAARLRDAVQSSGASVLAVTFTVAAAREMRHRLEGAGPNGASGVDVRTVHSLAYRICGEFNLVTRHSGWFLPDEEAIEWLLELSSDVGMIDLPPGHHHPDETLPAALLRLFQRWGENDAAPVPGEDGLSGELTFSPAVTRIHEAFLSRKRITGRGDFSDLVRLATRHLQDGGSASRRLRYAHVLVDEAQDLNLGQVAFLRALCRGTDGLTLVGDDDQSLYGFRGAIPNLLERAVSWFPEIAARGTERVELRDSRRCTTGVVRSALRLVNLNRRERPKILFAPRDGDLPQAFCLRDEQEEAAFVAWRIDALLQRGCTPESVAVLARTSSALRFIEAELVARRIPVAKRAGRGVLESGVARDVLAWLSLATAPDATSALLRVHDRPPSGIGRGMAARVHAVCERTGFTVREAMLSLAGGIPGAERAALLAFVDRLDALEECVSLAGSVRDALETVLRVSGYAEWLAAEDKQDSREDLDLLLSIGESADDLDEFLIATCVSQTDDWVGTAGRVHMTTLHGAKGLEWDHVFLAGAHGRSVPHSISVQEFDVVRAHWPGALLRFDPVLTIGRGGVEEERRLFHVGLTRARETAVVTCSSSVRVLGKRQAVSPTPFLAEAGIPLSEPPHAWQSAAKPVRGMTSRSVATWREEQRGKPTTVPESSQMSLF